MPRNTIRDILPPERRKKRAVRPADRIRQEMQDEDEAPDVAEQTSPDRHNVFTSEETDPHHGGGHNHDHFDVFEEEDHGGFWSKGVILKIIGAVVVVVVVVGLVSSLIFSGAEITVTPKVAAVNIEATITAKEKAGPGELQYELMKLEKVQTKSVEATGTEYAEVKASGVITIFNAYSNSEQRLVRNTRFESPDGLIYRINESIVVPGQSTVAGDTTPGSIDVMIYADEPGESYNIGLTEFTIPGFKGAPQFEHFYAQSKEGISGGFEGDRIKVNDTDLAKARDDLRSSLGDALQAEVGGHLTDDHYLFEDALFVDYNSKPLIQDGENAQVEERATLYGIMFDKAEFSKFVAENSSANLDGAQVLLEDPMSNFTVSFPDKNEMRPWETGEVSITIRGSDSVVWQYDEMRLKEDLVGQSKDRTHTILPGHPGIDKAVAVIKPFWKGTFPNDIEKISVINTRPVGHMTEAITSTKE